MGVIGWCVSLSLKSEFGTCGLVYVRAYFFLLFLVLNVRVFYTAALFF